ncbi:MAG: thiol peroxidase [Chloroflexi bacterium]|nr:thiol peroxidase [Chloroflexota bacterium]
MLERRGLIQFGGRDVTIVGPDLKPGDTAPEFTATTQDWQDIQVLDSTRGKVRIIAAVPSLDTPVCDRETRRFNEAAAALSDDIAIVVVSADLPFAQKRWCGAAGVEQVMVVSDHKDMDFGAKYGCLMKEVRLLRRAVFVVDRDGKIVYADYMPELGLEPNYDEVLAAAQAALAR